MHYEDSLDTDGDLDPGQAAGGGRPAHVPAKFWDNAQGQLRTEALLRAYLDLERMASSPARRGVPASPEQYCIQCRHPALTSDAAVNQRLHQAGFSQEQAQLVYDLAHERMLPLVEALQQGQGQNGNAAGLDQLREHFGGETKLRQIAPQLTAWGRKELPADAFKALSSSPEGVKALHRLMLASSDEPALGRLPAAKDDAPSEDQLKKMMQDPRYWKNRDPAFIDKVTSGFRRLYGND